MRITAIVASMLLVLFLPSEAGTLMVMAPSPENGFEAKILRSRQGDYPVGHLNLLPERQGAGG
jgi:hypothetical protein